MLRPDERPTQSRRCFRPIHNNFRATGRRWPSALANGSGQSTGGPDSERPVQPLPMGAPGPSHLGTWETTDPNRPKVDQDDQHQSSKNGRWSVRQIRRITLNLEKLCPVHRGFIAMSGRRPHGPCSVEGHVVHKPTFMPVGGPQGHGYSIRRPPSATNRKPTLYPPRNRSQDAFALAIRR
jgi:hypothetical protein